MTNDVICDAFDRIKQTVHETVTGLSRDSLSYRPSESANSIAWLIWHLTRIQDDHIADLARKEQLWIRQNWYNRFALPFAPEETGYGHTADEVGHVQVGDDLLLGYYDEVHDSTIAYLSTLSQSDYSKVIDTRWNPPVTVAVRLVSVIADDLQHAGQAAYVRGLLE